MKLKDYIFNNDLKKKDFAKAQGVDPCVVSKWLKDGYVVFEGKLYSERRVLVGAIEAADKASKKGV